MWIFIWSQNLKKKALGTQSCGFGKSQLFLNISTDRLSPVGAERNILACSSTVRPLGIRASLPGSSKEVVFLLNSEGGRQLTSQMASVVSHEGKSVTVTGNGACGWTDTKCYVLLHAAREGVLGLLWIIPFWTSFSMCSGAWRWRWAHMNGKFTNIHIRLYI